MAIIGSTRSSSFTVTMETVKIQQEYNPEAIVKYFSRGVKTGRCKDSDLVMNAKKHLSAIGWTFTIVFKAPKKKELRYRSPAGKNYISLIKACESLVDHQGCYRHNLVLGNSKIQELKKPAKKLEKFDHDSFKIQEIKKPGNKSEKCDHHLDLGSFESEEFKEPESKSENYNDDLDLGSFQIEEFSRELEKQLLNYDNDLDLGDSKIEKFKEPQTKSENNDNIDLDDFKIEEISRDMELKSVNNQEFSSNNRPMKKIRLEDVEKSYFTENKKFQGKKIQDVKRIMELGKKGNKLKPNKVIQKAKGGKCVLSLLIEKGVVLRGSNVSYKKKDGTVIAKGRIYDEGIQCNCCGLFFLLSKFEVHAGSTYHRPAAYLFLDDDRSLFDCQALLNLNRENKPSKVIKTKSADQVMGNDEFCLFCKDGGELLFCDSCTSSFHSTCIGLNGVPDSDYWFCPSCSCRICHQGQISKSTTKEQVKCVQCEHYFHIDCIKKLGFSVSFDSAKWLCSEKCERIYVGLIGILGKPIPLPVDSLSWSLVKFENNENDMCKITESYSKLLVALDVIHECFQPVKHPWSDNDLLEDVIFCRSSKRSSFKGFYTAVLEKDNEMITVVSVRIHGCKVAEIPLVATRFRYRRLGMCRILMNEIERKLGDLGVERLVLEAVPEMISTWTESFGFSVMTEPERLDVAECKFLEFPGTIKCHKILKKT